MRITIQNSAANGEVFTVVPDTSDQADCLRSLAVSGVQVEVLISPRSRPKNAAAKRRGS